MRTSLYLARTSSAGVSSDSPPVRCGNNKEDSSTLSADVAMACSSREAGAVQPGPCARPAATPWHPDGAGAWEPTTAGSNLHRPSVARDNPNDVQVSPSLSDLRPWIVGILQVSSRWLAGPRLRFSLAVTGRSVVGIGPTAGHLHLIPGKGRDEGKPREDWYRYRRGLTESRAAFGGRLRAAGVLF